MKRLMQRFKMWGVIAAHLAFLVFLIWWVILLSARLVDLLPPWIWPASDEGPRIEGVILPPTDESGASGARP